LQRIKFQHNIPILGWLTLRGRCRVCHLPIALRYVLVELLVGLIFLSLFFAELASGGRSLPIRPPNRLPGVMWNVITPQLDLLGLYAYHCCMLSVLVVCSLLGLDRVPIPKRLIVFSCLVGIGCPLVWPQLSVVPWHPTASLSSDAWNRLATPLAGLGFGVCLGYLVEIVEATKTGATSRITGDVAKTLAIIGVFVGWQAVVLSLLITTIFHAGSAWWRRGTTLWAFWILFGTTLMLCNWRSISSVRCLPGAESSLPVHGYWVVSMLVVLFVTNEFGPSRGEMYAVRNRVASR
jgi:prepilin signal peptidase PulO-like enzyme (type II secretory pathway)